MARIVKHERTMNSGLSGFSRGLAKLEWIRPQIPPWRIEMFAFDRSAVAVLAPLALLLAVVAWSNRAAAPAPQRAQVESPASEPPAAEPAQTVAANLPSR